MDTYLDPTQTSFSAIRARLRGSTRLVNVDLRPGSWEGDILDAAAVELAQAALLGQDMYAQLFAETASGTQLDDLVLMRASLTRLAAVAAGSDATESVTVTVTPSTTVPLGQRFSTSGAAPQYFDATAAVTDGGSGTVTVPVVAEVAGAVGNVPAGAINLIVPTVPGGTVPANLLTVTNPAAFTTGQDVETDAALRTRYLSAIQKRRTAGNWADYDAWAREVNGVGNVVVLETPTGAGSVGISLLGEDNLPASGPIVAAVQAHIMPVSPAEGVGSIGPTDLSIYAAPSVAINIAFTGVYDTGVSTTVTKAALKANFTAYLASIAFATNNDVQPDQVGTRISALENGGGMTSYDITTLRVNGGTVPIVIAADHVAVLGTVTVNGVVI